MPGVYDGLIVLDLSWGTTGPMTTMFLADHGAAIGRFEDPGLLVEFSDTPGAVRRGPCLCGEHTRELLREHGYSDDEIGALTADGAVLDAPVERVSA